MKLYRHGEHPEQQLSADLPEPEVPLQEGANFSGVVKRFDKYARAHENGMSMGWVRQTYVDALEWTRAGDGARGLGFFSACVSLMIGMSAAWVIGSVWMDADWVEYLISVFGVVMVFFAIVVIPLFSIRTELFSPEDLPVIFDRKHRKVY